MKKYVLYKVVLVAVAAAVTGLVVPRAQAGDPEAGKAKIGTCMACHGNDGKATQPIYPNLAGQNEKYLVEALKAYKSGARNNPIMKPMASTLSDTDVENVAAYFASQSPCK